MRNKNTTEDKDKKMTENATENVRRLIREKKIVDICFTARKEAYSETCHFLRELDKKRRNSNTGWLDEVYQG
jgi:hypothetical protein